MDKLLEASKFYITNLNNKRFLILASKNKKIILLEVLFEESRFKHLLGLHKLEDLGFKSMSSSSLLQNILSGNITLEDIKKSIFFCEMENRLDNFEKITETLFSSDAMLKSLHGTFGQGTGIRADYLLSKKDDGEFLHLFFQEKGEIVIPVTYFSQPTEFYLRHGGYPLTIIDVQELHEKEDVKRKIQIETIKAQLSATTDFTEIKEITKDVLETGHVNFSKLDEHEKD